MRRKIYVMHWCKCINTKKPKKEKWSVDIYLCNKCTNYSFGYTEYDM